MADLVLVLGILVGIVSLIVIGIQSLFSSSDQSFSAGGSGSSQATVTPRQPARRPAFQPMAPVPAYDGPPPTTNPGIYVFGHIWHWDGFSWTHESPVDIEPITGFAGDYNTVTTSGWEDIWERQGGYWRKAYTNPAKTRYQDIWYDAAHQKKYVVGSRNAIMTSWPGEDWGQEQQPKDVLFKAVQGYVSASGETEVYAVGFYGTIMRSTGDQKWSMEESNVDVTLHGIAMDGESVYVVGEEGVILRRNHGGYWVREAVDIAESFSGAWADERGGVYAVTDEKSVYYSTGDGQWTKQATLKSQLTSIWGLNAEEIYAVGLGGTIAWSNGNGEWMDMSGTDTLTIAAIWGNHANDIWIGGDQMYTIKEDGSFEDKDSVVVRQKSTR